MSTERARLMRRARRYLATWMTNVGLDNGQGLTDINSDAEPFCCGLLNIALDVNLQNMNLQQMNFPAIDLADPKRRICVQVTSTADAEKITHTLDRFFAYGLEKDYDRLIVMILGKKKNYRTLFPQKEGFQFDPLQDVWDIQKLLTRIAGLSMPQLRQVDDYLREQLSDLEEQAPTMDLPLRSALDDASFFGREDELAQIAGQFEQRKLVILSGLGGMGKTELAVRFALTRWGGDSYFVHFTKNWRQTVLENIAPRIRGLNRDGADPDRIYRDAMAELKSHGADELLIIDNVDQEEASLTQLQWELSELSLRILITTRTDTAQKISVAQLQYEELDRLFALHESNVSAEAQRQLIDAVDGHTLTVDLMARALRPGRRAATADKLLRDLSDVTIRKVATAYPGAPAQARIIEHLKVVFRVVELEDDEQELLRYATLLPDAGMDDSLFLAPIGKDMDDALDHLIDNGWLNFKDELLSIHPVIRKVCADVLTPCDENCGEYLNVFIAQYDENDYQLERLHQMVEMLTKAADHLADTQGTWALKAGEHWRNVGDFTQTQKYSLRAMEKMERDPASDAAALALAYNNAGLTYGDLGDHQRALNCHQKSLAIRQKILSPDHRDLARSYNNVGFSYGNLEDYQKALNHLLKAMEILEKVFHDSHPDLATAYNNVGAIYGYLGDHQKELVYQMKAMGILENLFPDGHPDLAAVYNNIGSTYGALGDHRKELDYQKKALAIWEKVLHTDHPNLALSCRNVAWDYHNMGQYQEAARYMRRAADIIIRSSLPEDHPDRVDYINWADQFEKDAKMQQMLLAQAPQFGAPPFLFPKK